MENFISVGRVFQGMGGTDAGEDMMRRATGCGEWQQVAMGFIRGRGEFTECVGTEKRLAPGSEAPGRAMSHTGGSQSVVVPGSVGEAAFLLCGGSVGVGRRGERAHVRLLFELPAHLHAHNQQRSGLMPIILPLTSPPCPLPESDLLSIPSCRCPLLPHEPARRAHILLSLCRPPTAACSLT